MQSHQPDNSQDGGGRALRNFALLTLPWLAAQRDMLGLCKSYIKDENCGLPIHNFLLREIQALAMVYDPSRKVRDACAGIGVSIENAYNEALPTLVSGAVGIIEAQEAMVGSMIDALAKLKKSPDQAKKGQ